MAGGGFGNIQARDTTQAEVLLAIVSKIQSSITIFADESSCFISAVPWPSVELQGNLFVTGSPGDGTFDLTNLDGGGNVECSELATFTIAVWSRIQTDEIERFQEGFTDSERGLLVIKQQILAALAGRNLDGGSFEGNPSILLEEALNPSKSRIQVEKTNDDDFAGLILTFEGKWNWGLGGYGELT